MTIKPVKELSPEVSRKIAAGEVIDRPGAVVRELIDNAIDAGADRITVEITGGGIARIRVTDNGCGMTAEDIAICTNTHTTSKIHTEDDLLNLETLGFRGEALSSIRAVSQLEIITTRDGREAWKLEDGRISPARLAVGTVVQIDGLFDNFPARKHFLKRAAAETALCRQIFIEKALAWPEIEFRFSVDGNQKMILPSVTTLKERCLAALQPAEPESFFYEISGSNTGFSFSAVVGSPEVVRKDRKQLMVFVNGRRVMEYSLLQAIEYGGEGHFPNGGHPFCCLFISINPAQVDFNIHPAKKEVRFRDPGILHHEISSTIKNFYHRYTIKMMNPPHSSETAFQESPENIQQELDIAGGSFISTRDPAPHYNSFSGRSWSEQPRFPDTAAYKPADYYRKENAGDGPIRKEDEQNSRAFSDIPQDFRFLGQVLGTFIAAEKDGILYLIDQHAAHERILYNELMADSGKTQDLLIPYRIETHSDSEDAHISANCEQLAEAGFILNNEGDGIWQVTAVPLRWTGTEKDLRDALLDFSAGAGSLVSHLYATAACRAACKDGDILDPLTARNLAARTFSLPEPVCPHGRPVWITIDREELFRRVKRT
ncbi:DNA mismatch repair endonuclease MutL [Brucepastera parasyntrophica]|uniref:DNA mismatch repair endonuclease MutL n=1 Tax=Brucepastera parasyntrophica TaxID=2880008 RepID=UPI00210E1B92|nr:DNA mismatch repair endonuclease MutL [Brucepastera parasyntrophica]ULQ60138.1 DNA mismatch repair endonuclease MutL [Brucepastera parasyntrophica]